MATLPVELLRGVLRHMLAAMPLDVFMSKVIETKSRVVLEDAYHVMREAATLPPDAPDVLSISAIAPRFPLLQTLVLRSQRFQRPDMECISQLTALTRLDIGDSTFAPGTEDLLPGGLRHLDISGLNRLDGLASYSVNEELDIDLGTLCANVNALTYLDMSFRKFKNPYRRHFASLRQLRNLLQLRIRGFRGSAVNVLLLPTQLEQLSLGMETAFTGDFGQMTRLTELELHADVNAPPYISHLTGLRSLSIDQACDLHAATALETLVLRGAASPVSALTGLSQLRHLVLECGAAESHLITQLAHLTQLDVILDAGGSQSITWLTTLATLRELKVSTTSQDVWLPDSLSSLLQLTSLVAANLHISRRALGSVGQLHNLRCLRFNESNAYDSFDMDALSELTQLTELCLRGQSSTPLNIGALSHFRGLTLLDISDCRLCIPTLTALTNLTMLGVIACGLVHNDYRVIQQLRTLKELDVSHNPRPSLRLLSSLKTLTSLRLVGCEILPADIRWLSSLRRLAFLNIASNPTVASASATEWAAISLYATLIIDHPESDDVLDTLSSCRTRHLFFE